MSKRKSPRTIGTRTDLGAGYQTPLGINNGASHANNPFTGSSFAKAAEGMIPKPYEIAPGTVLYRFIDLDKSPSVIGANGPWWFEFEHFQSIRQWAEQHQYNLSYAARLFAAILYEWSNVNAYVRARVNTPLKVWKGQGIQVSAQDKDGNTIEKMTPMQGINTVYQLYIPGLGYPHQQFSQWMTLLACKQIKLSHPYDK